MRKFKDGKEICQVYTCLFFVCSHTNFPSPPISVALLRSDLLINNWWADDDLLAMSTWTKCWTEGYDSTKKEKSLQNKFFDLNAQACPESKRQNFSTTQMSEYFLLKFLKNKHVPNITCLSLAVILCTRLFYARIDSLDLANKSNSKHPHTDICCQTVRVSNSIWFLISLVSISCVNLFFVCLNDVKQNAIRQPFLH